jgi:outer membrane lipoprotein SlyB
LQAFEASGFGGSENIGLSTWRFCARCFRMQGEHSMKRLIIAASVLAALAACTTTSPDVINRNDAQRLSTVQDGVILSLRPVVVEGSQSGIGSVAGGVVGGMAGGSVGGRRDSVVGGVVGAVVGGVVGNAVERFGTREEAVEILIQLKNGERRSVVQAKAGETLNPGDSVILVSTGGKVRVTKAPTVTPALAPNS